MIVLEFPDNIAHFALLDIQKHISQPLLISGHS